MADTNELVRLIVDEVVKIVDRRNGYEVATDEDIDRLFEDLD